MTEADAMQVAAMLDVVAEAQRKEAAALRRYGQAKWGRRLEPGEPLPENITPFNRASRPAPRRTRNDPPVAYSPTCLHVVADAVAELVQPVGRRRVWTLSPSGPGRWWLPR